MVMVLVTVMVYLSEEVGPHFFGSDGVTTWAGSIAPNLVFPSLYFIYIHMQFRSNYYTLHMTISCMSTLHIELDVTKIRNKYFFLPFALKADF